MNRFSIIVAACGVLVTGLLVSGQAYAQTTLSEEQTERIRQSCVTTQTSLRQLHASDGVLRVNRGGLYENISTKLMAPLNSRITLKGLGGLKLAATTVEYDRQLDVFRTDYIDYEESMSRTFKMNCVEQPVLFYENFQATRQKRQRVHEDTQTLATLLKAYKTEFETFVSEYRKGNNQ